MCEGCLKSVAPDRGTVCHEGGCYFVNFKGCGSCGKMDAPKRKDEKGAIGAAQGEGEGEGGAAAAAAGAAEGGSSSGDESASEGEERIEFHHVCAHCDHVIAKHTFTFRVEDGFQEYTMVCKLCGRGSDTASVLPDDPRRGAAFF